MTGCWGYREDNFWFDTFFLGETIFTRLYIGLFLRERERERERREREREQRGREGRSEGGREVCVGRRLFCVLSFS
ncbi:hypothetical protein DPMN_088564 [Dreissena polymorpha]|uniref:Uncharacterized protein n=1 Tax=Dreissena polymorpha TaxID=45954 RepID=A0A9D4KUS8_DREPO|nr:hypothetical protein DPMN_088564 [Dreissena polymorpha]